MAQIEFLIPVFLKKDGVKLKETELQKVRGQVAFYQIGGQKIKFVIQDLPLGKIQLTHYASGNIMVRTNVIGAMRIRHMHGGKTVTYREAIRLCLGELEKRIGLSKMLTVMAAAPIINK